MFRGHALGISVRRMLRGLSRGYSGGCSKVYSKRNLQGILRVIINYF